jgi:hypothetical protein
MDEPKPPPFATDAARSLPDSSCFVTVTNILQQDDRHDRSAGSRITQ